MTLTPVADTMARQQAPTSAAGSATTLLSDSQETTGTATRATTYLRFTVPALAAGESVVSASLAVQVTNATTDGPTIWRTVPSWDEATLTWDAGQPARSGTAAVGGFGSLATGRRSTSISGVAGGSDVSLQLYADSSDGVQIASRESSTTSARPTLTVTVSTGG
jgi:hypothetical protein